MAPGPAPTWGLVATILAPVPEILRFAAYHLEAGARRLHLYLDALSPEAEARLAEHPKVRVTNCDKAYWKRLTGKPPVKHQVRQSMNATHAYAKGPQVDWLIHMDVDEFLVAKRPVAEILKSLPEDQDIARIRPMEALAGTPGRYKAFIPPGPDRARIVEEIYPTYGRYVQGGFLSHLAGKVFVRTGMDGIRLQIHNAFRGGDLIPGPEQQAGIDLAHHHAKDWTQWLAAYRYRLEKGSYRAELGNPAKTGGMTLHQLFQAIETEEGEEGLRAFYDEVCTGSPALQERLARQDLLRTAELRLDAAVAKHFPV